MCGRGCAVSQLSSKYKYLSLLTSSLTPSSKPLPEPLDSIISSGAAVPAHNCSRLDHVSLGNVMTQHDSAELEMAELHNLID